MMFNNYGGKFLRKALDICLYVIFFLSRPITELQHTVQISIQFHVAKFYWYELLFKIAEVEWICIPLKDILLAQVSERLANSPYTSTEFYFFQTIHLDLRILHTKKRRKLSILLRKKIIKSVFPFSAMSDVMHKPCKTITVSPWKELINGLLDFVA